ncbi:cytochrome c biogenesis CcdA family protein [Oceanomicrobium pacificus]|uniref:Cytochrome c biogenesis protein CcdA n=1 Tax=Oceanomicrobium pacificus TaxID=2692916 RepID=A0A6B0U641_9RHOB|nr:cytochrome c biogenesis protein CcdA [Oceanomicrobium pacificus]MXU66351.1 cytochrome c biogenesis protein CcdA [Oceanomicrobium pacificus]
MFGVDIIDGSLLMAMGIALFAGVLSFLSPCVLPIVPPYLAYMAGTNMNAVQSGGRDWKVLQAAGFFVLGLSTVFLFLGFAASAFGQVFLAYQREMAIVAGIVIMIFGLHFLGIFRIPLLYREMRLDAGDRGGSAFGAYVLGLAFAFGWTPCIGPVLGAVLSMAAQEGSIARGTVLMAVYALGLGVPFLLAALFMRRSVSAMARLRPHMERIERIMGVLLYTVGLMMISGTFSDLSYWLLETFPALGRIG